MSLKRYRPERQFRGQFLLGYDWTLFFTGTYRRKPQDFEEATGDLQRFLSSFRQAMQFPRNSTACAAVLEREFSGLGHGGTRAHWHALIYCPAHVLACTVARQLWELRFGRAKLEFYDPLGRAAFYVSKLEHDDDEFVYDGLERMAYHGPTDLITSAAESSYVPDRLRWKTSGEYFVLDCTRTVSGE